VRRLAVVLGVLVAGASFARDPHPLSTDEIVGQVQQRYDATQDFTASVDQKIELVSAGRTITAHGTVAFAKGGKMRWELRNDEPQTIVADGSTLWFYQPEEHQVLRAPFEAAFRSSTPISFLTGVGKIADDFAVSVLKRSDDTIELELTPKNGDAELGILHLTVEKGSYDIVGAEIRDPVGNVTRLRFSDLQRNTGLDDARFRFEVPPGVDVVDAPIAE
jgi:outer membrane lipoprotein carrier protein